MAEDIRTAKLIISGGNTGLSLDERFGRVLTPFDFNPTGIDLAGNSVDAAPSVQAMFDAAFGSGSPWTPHGLANAHLNKPCFLPNGRYNLESSLTLTSIVGGLIYGGGLTATQLNYSGPYTTETPVLDINGMAHTTIRGISFNNASNQNSAGINLDWDNASGGDGLQNVVFFMCGLGGKYGLIVAKSGYGGSGIQLIAPAGAGGGNGAAGIDIRSDTASLLVLHPSIADWPVLYKAHKGTLVVAGGSGESTDKNFDIDGANTRVTVLGIRTESEQVFEVANGILKATGVNHGTSIEDSIFANITGGKVILDACHLNVNLGQAGISEITGNGGTLYMRGCATETGYRANYTGTVAQDI